MNFLSNIEINNIIQNYNYAQKVLASAILWLCGKMSDKQLDTILKGCVSTNEELQQLYGTVNSYTYYLGGKMFIPNNVEPAEFKFDADGLRQAICDLNRLDVLMGTNFPEIFDKANAYYVKETGYVITAIGGAKIPAFTTSKMVAENNAVDKQFVNKVEGFIGDIIDPYKHYIIPSNANPKYLSVVFPMANGMKTIDIDPGNQFGEYKALLPDDRIVNGTGGFYFTSNKELIKRYIENNIPLAAEDITDIILDEHQFMDQTLYQVVDVKDAQPIINQMERSRINRLENKLKFVQEIIKNKNNGRCPVFRIRNMKDENSFILVSDDKCNSPELRFDRHVISPHPYSVKVNKGTFIIIVGDAAGNETMRKQYKFDESLINQVYDSNFKFDEMSVVNDIVNDLKKIESYK